MGPLRSDCGICRLGLRMRPVAPRALENAVMDKESRDDQKNDEEFDFKDDEEMNGAICCGVSWQRC